MIHFFLFVSLLCILESIEIDIHLHYKSKKVVGPMLRFAEDLIPMMKVLCSSNEHSVGQEDATPRLLLNDDVSHIFIT